MLLWQRIAWHKRHSFLSKLFFFSTCVHGLMLFVLLFFYKGENFTQVINLDAHDMTVMFLPFQKTVAQSSGPVATAQRSGLKVINGSDKKKNSRKKKGKSSKVVPPATALVAEIKKKKKSEPKKPKQVEQKKEEKPLEQKIEQPEEQITVAQAETAELLDDAVVYAGQQDLAAMELCEQLREEIEQAWRPPVGLAAGRSCKVRVLVDWQGKAEEIVFEESSRVLAFDTSVRHALLTMNFPKSSYGKELILPFH